jgi:aspartate/glutamate racemase
MGEKVIMQSVGIIGGVGPATTGKFYEQIILGCQDTERGVNNLFFLTTTAQEQTELNNIILRLTNNRQTTKQIMKNMKNNGAKSIILACTDLQLLNPECKGVRIYDTLSILAQSVIQKIVNT